MNINGLNRTARLVADAERAYHDYFERARNGSQSTRPTATAETRRTSADSAATSAAKAKGMSTHFFIETVHMLARAERGYQQYLEGQQMSTTVQLPDEVQSAREVTIGDGDILVVKYDPQLPFQQQFHVQQWARELGEGLNRKTPVVLCPEPFDITAMPRADAVAMLQKFAAAIDCEIVDCAKSLPDQTQYTEEELHARRAHPDFEYETTTGPRKSWHDQMTPPEGEGWVVNIAAGRDGWDRFDYHEEMYWMRRK